MLKIKNTVKDYNIGNSKIELKFVDLFTDVNNGLVLNTKPTFCSVSNVGIVKDVELFTDKITFVPTKQIRTSNKVYNCIIKISANVPKLNATGQFDSTLGTTDKYYYIKIKLCPKIDGSDSELYIEAYEKLSPDQYQADKQHEKDNLDALVSKKALINNLKEFGNQVKNKIANTHKYEIKYDLAGGFWPDNNEGRHTFCNAEAYCPSDSERPERNGYTFKGWQLYKIEDETGTPLIPENEIDIDNMIQVGTDYDVEAEALWTPETITINIKNDAGELKGTVTTEYKEDLVLQNLIKSIAVPTKDCYILNGWEIKNSTYEKKVVFKDDIELYDLFSLNDFSTTIDLYPVYRPITAEIIFNFGTDTSIYLPDFKSKGNKYTYGQAFVLPVPIKLNYKFKGWTIKQKGKGGEPLLSNAETADKLHFIIDAFELKGYDKDTKLELTPSFVKEYISINYHLSDSSLIPYMSGIIQTSEYKTKFTRDELTHPNKVLLIAPSSTGFVFTGWKVGDDYNDIFKIDAEDNKYYLSVLDLDKFNKTELGATIDLYAIWEAENVDITVEIWGESVNSTGKYIAKDNDVVEADTCTYELSSVHKIKDFKALQNVPLSEIKSKLPSHLISFNGFKLKKFSENDDSTPVQIKPDGSTIVKFYYYREEYTVQVNDTIKGGYLNKSDDIKLKRIFNKKRPYEWKSILYSSNNTDPDFVDSFTVKYGQTIKQEAEFIKGLNLDKNTYGELSLECYSLPAKTIQSEQVDHSNIIFEFEYTRKKFPITLNLNGYGYFGDISNPTYSVTFTVQANTKADSVLGKDNFKYKTYWVYKDNIFHIPNKDEIITGPKVYNLEKRANIEESKIWREFKARSIISENNGVDLVGDSNNGVGEPDINETHIIEQAKFYKSFQNKKYTSFNELKKINIPNTKLGNYWLTDLNIHVNNSSSQPSKLKDLSIEYFEKSLLNNTNIDDAEIFFAPFVERLEPDIDYSSIISLSYINNENFKVNNIKVKDGASHVLVSLDNLNYENIIKISSSCIEIKKDTTSIIVSRNNKTINNDTVIYFIAIKKIRKNKSDFFVIGKMYGAKITVDGTNANLSNWQEVALPNIALKQNPYIISIKKNESAVNCIEFTDIEFSEEIKDLVFTIKNVSSHYDNNNNTDHNNRRYFRVFLKIFNNNSANEFYKLDNKQNEIAIYRCSINRKKIQKLQLYIIPTYYRNSIQGMLKENGNIYNLNFYLQFEIKIAGMLENNDSTKYSLVESTAHTIKYDLIKDKNYLACISQNASSNWGNINFNYNIGIRKVLDTTDKPGGVIQFTNSSSIVKIDESNQLFYSDYNDLNLVNNYVDIFTKFYNYFNLSTNTKFKQLNNKYLRFVGIYNSDNNYPDQNYKNYVNNCSVSNNYYNNSGSNGFWIVKNKDTNEFTTFYVLYFSELGSFLKSNTNIIKNSYRVNFVYFDVYNTKPNDIPDPLIFKCSSSSSSSSNSEFGISINTINISNSNINENIINKDFIKIKLNQDAESVLGKNYGSNSLENNYTKLSNLADITISSGKSGIIMANDQSYSANIRGNEIHINNLKIKALPVYRYSDL